MSLGKISGSLSTSLSISFCQHRRQLAEEQRDRYWRMSRDLVALSCHVSDIIRQRYLS